MFRYLCFEAAEHCGARVLACKIARARGRGESMVHFEKIIKVLTIILTFPKQYLFKIYK